VAVILTSAEAKALYDLIDQLSDGKAANTFPDDLGSCKPEYADFFTAAAKIFIAADHGSMVPKALGGTR